MHFKKISLLTLFVFIFGNIGGIVTEENVALHLASDCYHQIGKNFYLDYNSELSPLYSNKTPTIAKFSLNVELATIFGSIKRATASATMLWEWNDPRLAWGMGSDSTYREEMFTIIGRNGEISRKTKQSYINLDLTRINGTEVTASFDLVPKEFSDQVIFEWRRKNPVTIAPQVLNEYRMTITANTYKISDDVGALGKLKKICLKALVSFVRI
ncbi:uncharacterized protein LOC118439529 [Folsomia candida]|uniref:uncharacterized protein LOC118439529 n=1 Tax=Folsomia candida TaxID=158441 RepID=UPI0016052593|nr:uncharacterized protein LOC118439529 [Folsomia candida]